MFAASRDGGLAHADVNLDRREDEERAEDGWDGTEARRRGAFEDDDPKVAEGSSGSGSGSGEVPFAAFRGHASPISRFASFASDASLVATVDASGETRAWRWDAARRRLDPARLPPGPSGPSGAAIAEGSEPPPSDADHSEPASARFDLGGGRVARAAFADGVASAVALETPGGRWTSVAASAPGAEIFFPHPGGGDDATGIETERRDVRATSADWNHLPTVAVAWTPDGAAIVAARGAELAVLAPSSRAASVAALAARASEAAPSYHPARLARWILEGRVGRARRAVRAAVAALLRPGESPAESMDATIASLLLEGDEEELRDDRPRDPEASAGSPVPSSGSSTPEGPPRASPPLVPEFDASAFGAFGGGVFSSASASASGASAAANGLFAPASSVAARAHPRAVRVRAGPRRRRGVLAVAIAVAVAAGARFEGLGGE